MLAISKNVLFRGRNHLLATGTDDLASRVILKVSDYQNWWLVGGYDMKIGRF